MYIYYLGKNGETCNERFTSETILLKKIIDRIGNVARYYFLAIPAVVWSSKFF